MTGRSSSPNLAVAKNWASHVAGVREEARDPDRRPATEAVSKANKEDFLRGVLRFITAPRTTTRSGEFGLGANEAFWYKDGPRGWWYLKDSAPSSAEVLEDMVGPNAGKYTFECANFVYFAQLYGILTAIGASRFDKEMERDALTFNVYKHETHFMRALYGVDEPDEIPIGADITFSADGTLKKTGGEGTWDIVQMIPEPWRNEHVVKLDSEAYFGYGLPSEKTPSDFQGVVEAYAGKIVEFLGDRRFVEFLDDTEQPMNVAARIAFLSENRLKISSIYEVVLGWN